MEPFFLLSTRSWSATSLCALRHGGRGSQLVDWLPQSGQFAPKAVHRSGQQSSSFPPETSSIFMQFIFCFLEPSVTSAHRFSSSMRHATVLCIVFGTASMRILAPITKCARCAGQGTACGCPFGPTLPCVSSTPTRTSISKTWMWNRTLRK